MTDPNVTRIQANIEMMARYGQVQQAAELRDGLAAYHRFVVGEIPRHQLPLLVRELITEQPEWATRGT